MIDQTEKDRWAGVFTALVTPFRDGEIDLPAFDALVERQIAAGVAGLVPVGTTGEAATLSDAEAVGLIERTVRIAAGRVLVVAGAGSNDTGKTVAKVRAAEKAGADAVLVVTPYYNKPTQAGLIAHYDAVAAATGRPVMLYSVPGRCGVEIAPSTCAELMARRANVFVIKEAGGSVERVTRLRAACGDDLIVHSGDDGLTLPFLALGAAGVTSVVANVAPEAMVALVAAWRRGDSTRASPTSPRRCSWRATPVRSRRRWRSPAKSRPTCACRWFRSPRRPASSSPACSIRARSPDARREAGAGRPRPRL